MNGHIRARCEHMATEVGNVKVFTFRALHASAEFLEALRPGGYVAIEYHDLSGAQQQRHYSITRKSAPDLFEIAVRKTGQGGVADSLHASVTEGTIISVAYAAGAVNVAAIGHYQHVMMLAGGIGLTLPLALLRELVRLAGAGHPIPRVTLFLCSPAIPEVAFLHELLDLALTSDWFTLRVFITRQELKTPSLHFLAGRPSDEVLGKVAAPDAVVICGSHAFAAQTQRKMGELHPDADVLIESFSAAARAAPAVANEAPAGSVRLNVVGQSSNLHADPAKSILENLEMHGIPIRSQCRTGICGSCRLKVVSGECRREADFCLNAKDIDSGYALACCTYPLAGDFTISLAMNG